MRGEIIPDIKRPSSSLTTTPRPGTSGRQSKNYNYYYQTQRKKNIHVKIDEFLKNREVEDEASEEVKEVSSKNIDSKQRFYKECKGLWNKYEELWKTCETTQVSITDIHSFPWPPEVKLLHIHLKETYYKNEIADPNLWKKIKKEAIFRYHPDKIQQKFSLMIKSKFLLQEVLTRANEICGILLLL